MTRAKLRVVAFTKTTAIGPSSRYRYAQHRERLAARGVDLALRPLFGATWFRLLAIRPRVLALPLKALYTALRFAARATHLLGAANSGDTALIVVEHQLFPYLPAFAEAWLRKRGRRFTVEFDDAIHLTRGHGAKLPRLCRLADAVVVGNRVLADYAKQFQPRVAVVPTAIDLARYPRPDGRGGAKPTGAPFVIGWIGLPYNFGALRLLEAPLRVLAAERPVVLRIVSSGRPDLADIPVEVRTWSEAREVAEIREFDAGVMPLPDDAWSRGKCALKILQYMAAGVPVVASPVGVNADVVQDGVNGYLAADADAWLDRLRRLAADPALRRRLGTAGRETVERDFDAGRWADELADVWREASGARAWTR